MRDQIYPLVRRMILTGAIKPGEVIDEKEIAAQLEVSRTPVREAVKKLSDENLVEVVAQSGTRAARIDRKEIAEAFLIRRALESESAAQAATRMTQAHVDRLEDILMLHAPRASNARTTSKPLSATTIFTVTSPTSATCRGCGGPLKSRKPSLTAAAT